MTIFKTLADAIRAGYHYYSPTENGILVRIKTPRGFALAIALKA